MNSGVSISAMTEADLAARVFVDYYGVPEDPASGSGNGCLLDTRLATTISGPTCRR